MNSVSLIGNLASDVELKELAEEKKVANFLLAVDRFGKDSDADFFSVSVWNRQAEICDQYLAKGRRIALEGRLRSRSWEDENGKRRREVEVVANTIEFLSPPTDSASVAEIVPFEPAVAS